MNKDERHIFRQKLFHYIFYTILLCTFPLLSQSENFEYRLMPFKYRTGDHPTRTMADYNSRHWRFLPDVADTTNAVKRVWIRSDVYIQADTLPLPEMFLFIQLPAAYEVYWDGKQIGNNLIDSAHIDSLNGRLAATIHIPSDLLQEGRNKLALKCAAHAKTRLKVERLSLHTGKDFFIPPMTISIFPFILFCIHGILAGYYLRSYKKEQRRKRYLFWAFLLICLAIQNLCWLYILNTNIPYHYLFQLQTFQDILVLLLYGSIPLFFCYEFDFPYKKTIFAATAFFVLVDFVAILDDPFFQVLGLLPSLIVILWAASQQKEAGFHALFGIFCLAAILFSGFSVTLLEIGFLIFIFFISISISRRLALQSQAHETSRLRSARLETEMLRKLIQPHYIMNSLNAVIDWLEEAPEKGVEFIHALSEEFRILSRISHKALIPVEEEIRMCRAHLKIMTFRKEKQYYFETTDVVMSRTIPPGIFHTIVENGVTHDPNFAEQMAFILKEEPLENGIRYRLINRQADVPESLQTHQGKSRRTPPKGFVIEPLNEGTGLKYVKARLTESYGDDWHVFAEPVVGGWETVIEIYYIR